MPGGRAHQRDLPLPHPAMGDDLLRGRSAITAATAARRTLSVRNNQIIRANNRDLSGFNGEFLCVKGRFGWDFVNSDKRLTAPLIRRNGQQVGSTWDETLGVTVERLKGILAEYGPEAIAGHRLQSQN